MNFMMENNAGQRPEETTMRKRFIGICIIGIMACSIFGCADTAEDMLAAETEVVETAYTETEVSGKTIVEEESAQSEEVRVKTEDADEMPDAEPYTFSVRNLDDVRLDGKTAGDFYITNAVNYHKGLYYINSENQLYRQIYDFDVAAGKEINENVPDTLIAENVVHIDCDSPTTIILTQNGRLYGMDYGSSSIFSILRMDGTNHIDEPVLLMEEVIYALCGHGHIVVLKKDGSVWTWGSMGYEQSNNYNGYMIDEPIKLFENAVMISGRYGSHAALLEDGTVWTWGDNAYNQCGVPGQGYIEEPVCVTQDADAIWMQDLYFNNDLIDWAKSWQYTYNRGHFDNLVIRKKDGSLWACGKNIEGKNSREQDGVTYTYEFMPCEIVQQLPIVYDGLNTYQSILQEYERAWEDESYTREQWQEVNDGFVRWNDSKEYASLCYSLSDLTGDGTEELLIGFLIEDTCNVYLIYAYDKQEEVITEVWGFAADRAVTLYGDGIFESFWNSGGVEYYDYYQLQKDSGVRKRIDEYSDNWLWSETAEDRYYKGDVKIGITEEEFWDAVNSYRAMPQIDLEWHELAGFWEPESVDEVNYDKKTY